MNRRVCGLAAASLLMSGTAVAQPVQLSNSQMDNTTAGFLEIDRSNTSYTVVSLFQTPNMFVPFLNTVDCSNCYLLIETPRLSVGSRFGP